MGDSAVVAVVFRWRSSIMALPPRDMNETLIIALIKLWSRRPFPTHRLCAVEWFRFSLYYASAWSLTLQIGHGFCASALNRVYKIDSELFGVDSTTTTIPNSSDLHRTIDMDDAVNVQHEPGTERERSVLLKLGRSCGRQSWDAIVFVFASSRNWIRKLLIYEHNWWLGRGLSQ